MMNDRRLMVQNYVRAYNQFDIKGMTRDLSQQIVFENISGSKTTIHTKGLEDFITLARNGLSMFTSRKQSILNWNIETNKVIIDVSFEAILAQDLPGGLKAGDTLSLTGKSEFTFSGEQITHIRDYSKYKAVASAQKFVSRTLEIITPHNYDSPLRFKGISY